ncbi:MAG: HIT family protein [Bacilli bacterium]|nr:HIT family protein [Bacilli bacterium]
MNTLKNYTDEQIIKMIENHEIEVGDFLDSGICPTCFDKRHKGVLYGDASTRMIYEDETMECQLVGNPRAEGHTIISTKKHFRDMMELDDETCQKVFVMAKKVMNALKDIYGAKSVYECTMCDGEMNHFHIQLIPRYDYEKRGSKNFVKERKEYKEDKEKLNKLRERLNQ